MRILIGTLIAAGIAFTACSAPPADGDLQPQDFAYGITVSAPVDQAFFRVDMPTPAFTETAWPDMRDVRVFNAAGEAVPFARVVPRAANGATRLIALQPYRLAPETGREGARIEFDANAQSLEMRVVSSQGQTASDEYLLASEEAEAKTPIDKLHLQWKEHTENWQQKVTVATSADLRTWTTVAFARPVMDLKAEDGQRMTYGEIALDAAAWQPGRFWRLQFEPGFSPALTAVEAETTPEHVSPAGETIVAAVRTSNSEGTVYRLQTPQMAAHVAIIPADINSVLPVQIDGRESEDGAWRPLTSGVAYRLETSGKERASSPFAVGGATVLELRVRPIGTSWGARAPRVEVIRDRMALVVNARGAGPFLLAWGSRAAADSAVPLATVVPGRAADAPLDFPYGTFASRQVLGGPSRLTALAPVERTKRWQTVLVWVALVGAAGILGMLAVRVWRESRKTLPPA